MQRRYVSIWFRHLVTDWITRRQPELKSVPFVLCDNVRGRMVVTKANPIAVNEGIFTGMALADARALIPDIIPFDDRPQIPEKLLSGMADWCIRYTPSVCLDLPDGLLMDITGCPHLFGGEIPYLKDIVTRLRDFGYDARAAMADTVGGAWAVARFALKHPIVPPQGQKRVLSTLPPAALRLDSEVADRLHKLGITTIAEIYAMPRASLSRRFGAGLLLRLDQALGDAQEAVTPIRPIEPYSERLNSPEGVCTLEGIALALNKLLARICERFEHENKGLRFAELECVRVDGQVERIEVGTSQPTKRASHIFKLFENKLQHIEPALGIETFILTARQVEPIQAVQGEIPDDNAMRHDDAIPELVDSLTNRLNPKRPYRLLAQEHHWPERSIKGSANIADHSPAPWVRDKLRPIRLLRRPEAIDVTAPVPDYPPMFFRYKGVLHRIRKADGPERIEREWWLEKGELRDYYRLEDEQGCRYWVFRSGHFAPEKQTSWFLHGFFP